MQDERGERVESGVLVLQTCRNDIIRLRPFQGINYACCGIDDRVDQSHPILAAKGVKAPVFEQPAAKFLHRASQASRVPGEGKGDELEPQSMCK